MTDPIDPDNTPKAADSPGEPGSQAPKDVVDLRGAEVSALRFSSLSGWQQYLDRHSQWQHTMAQDRRLCADLLDHDHPVHLQGYCAACEQTSLFSIASEENWPAFRQSPNWRETLICEQCGLINRLRAAIAAFRQYAAPRSQDAIYITERVTPLYQWLEGRFSNLIGSEYLGDDLQPGSEQTIANIPVTHQDVTQLSLGDAEVQHVLTFDVLEHVPNYRRALGEFHRIMQPGGTLMISVPFLIDRESTLVRARLGPNGVEHLEPPEYHGDPVRSDEGALCFYHFAWDLLDELAEAGFDSPGDPPRVLLYWDPESAYLGWGGLLLVARKPS